MLNKNLHSQNSKTRLWNRGYCTRNSIHYREKPMYQDRYCPLTSEGGWGDHNLLANNPLSSATKTESRPVVSPNKWGWLGWPQPTGQQSTVIGNKGWIKTVHTTSTLQPRTTLNKNLHSQNSKTRLWNRGYCTRNSIHYREKPMYQDRYCPLTSEGGWGDHNLLANNPLSSATKTESRPVVSPNKWGWLGWPQPTGQQSTVIGNKGWIKTVHTTSTLQPRTTLNKNLHSQNSKTRLWNRGYCTRNSIHYREKPMYQDRYCPLTSEGGWGDHNLLANNPLSSATKTESRPVVSPNKWGWLGWPQPTGQQPTVIDNKDWIKTGSVP